MLKNSCLTKEISKSYETEMLFYIFILKFNSCHIISQVSLIHPKIFNDSLKKKRKRYSFFWIG